MLLFEAGALEELLPEWRRIFSKVISLHFPVYLQQTQVCVTGSNVSFPCWRNLSTTRFLPEESLGCVTHLLSRPHALSRQ